MGDECTPVEGERRRGARSSSPRAAVAARDGDLQVDEEDVDAERSAAEEAEMSNISYVELIDLLVQFQGGLLYIHKEWASCMRRISISCLRMVTAFLSPAFDAAGGRGQGAGRSHGLPAIAGAD